MSPVYYRLGVFNVLKFSHNPEEEHILCLLPNITSVRFESSVESLRLVCCCHTYIWSFHILRLLIFINVTACLENLEMLVILRKIRELSAKISCQGKVA